MDATCGDLNHLKGKFSEFIHSWGQECAIGGGIVTYQREIQSAEKSEPLADRIRAYRGLRGTGMRRYRTSEDTQILMLRSTHLYCRYFECFIECILIYIPSANYYPIMYRLLCYYCVLAQLSMLFVSLFSMLKRLM